MCANQLVSCFSAIYPWGGVGAWWGKGTLILTFNQYSWRFAGDTVGVAPSQPSFIEVLKTHEFCEFEQALQFFWPSVSSSVKWKHQALVWGLNGVNEHEVPGAVCLAWRGHSVLGNTKAMVVVSLALFQWTERSPFYYPVISYTLSKGKLLYLCSAKVLIEFQGYKRLLNLSSTLLSFWVPIQTLRGTSSILDPSQWINMQDWELQWSQSKPKSQEWNWAPFSPIVHILLSVP